MLSSVSEIHNDGPGGLDMGGFVHRAAVGVVLAVLMALAGAISPR
jgi:hypothetical protein